MKKTCFIFAVCMLAILSCSNPSHTPENKGMTVPSDSARIDTLKGTDTVIRG